MKIYKDIYVQRMYHSEIAAWLRTINWTKDQRTVVRNTSHKVIAKVFNVPLEKVVSLSYMQGNIKFISNITAK